MEERDKERGREREKESGEGRKIEGARNFPKVRSFVKNRDTLRKFLFEIFPNGDKTTGFRCQASDQIQKEKAQQAKRSKAKQSEAKRSKAKQEENFKTHSLN